MPVTVTSSQGVHSLSAAIWLSVRVPVLSVASSVTEPRVVSTALRARDTRWPTVGHPPCSRAGEGDHGGQGIGDARDGQADRGHDHQVEPHRATTTPSCAAHPQRGQGCDPRSPRRVTATCLCDTSNGILMSCDPRSPRRVTATLVDQPRHPICTLAAGTSVGHFPSARSACRACTRGPEELPSAWTVTA